MQATRSHATRNFAVTPPPAYSIAFMVALGGVLPFLVIAGTLWFGRMDSDGLIRFLPVLLMVAAVLALSLLAMKRRSVALAGQMLDVRAALFRERTPITDIDLEQARVVDLAERLLDSRQLRELPHGRGAFAAGLVTQRQRPATASGTVFVTLEDEHGMVNVVVWRDLAIKRRKALLGARLLAVRGRWEQVDGVAHLIARDLQDMSHLLGELPTGSRDFH